MLFCIPIINSSKIDDRYTIQKVQHLIIHWGWDQEPFTKNLLHFILITEIGANVFSSGHDELLFRRDDHEDDLQGSVEGI